MNNSNAGSAETDAGHPKVAPPPLDVVQRLVNTRNQMRGYDLLEAPLGAPGEWLVGVPYERADQVLEELRMLREGLRKVLTAHGTHVQIAPNDRTELESSLRAATFTVRVDQSGALNPTVLGDDPVSRVAQAALTAQRLGTWNRLKVCANLDCRWAFFDHSRNHSGTWCDMAICGSRAKMRTYRKRHSTRRRP